MVSGPGLLFFLSRRGIGERAAAAPVLELVWSRFAACVGCSADRLGWLALPLSSRGDGAGATSRSCQRTRGSCLGFVAGEKRGVEEGETGDR